jgi:hypothetical protein
MLTQQPGDDEEVLVHMMSEVGVTKLLKQFEGSADDESSVKLVGAGRLGPGEMLSVNLKEGRLYLNDAVKQAVASKKPYEQWAEQTVIPLVRQSFSKEIENYAEKFDGSVPADSTSSAPLAVEDNQKLITMQSFFGWGMFDDE